MKTVNIDYDHIVDNEEEEIAIELDFRCYFATHLAFYPMEVTASIYSGLSLQSAIKECKESYEKDYLKVQIVNVRIDLK